MFAWRRDKSALVCSHGGSQLRGEAGTANVLIRTRGDTRRSRLKQDSFIQHQLLHGHQSMRSLPDGGGGVAFLMHRLTATRREDESCDVRGQRSKVRSGSSRDSSEIGHVSVGRIKAGSKTWTGARAFSRKKPERMWAGPRAKHGRNHRNWLWFSGAAGKFLPMTECETTTRDERTLHPPPPNIPPLHF